MSEGKEAKIRELLEKIEALIRECRVALKGESHE